MAAPSPTYRSVSVRRYESADQAFVARLSDEAFAEYQPRPSVYTLHALRRATGRTFIAVVAGAPVGMIVLDGAADEWWVLAIAVAAPYRARGIGGVLLQTAEGHATAHAARRLSLFTADANLAALELFLRRGFRIVERRERFYARRQAACKLTKELRAAR